MHRRKQRPDQRAPWRVPQIQQRACPLGKRWVERFRRVYVMGGKVCRGHGCHGLGAVRGLRHWPVRGGGKVLIAVEQQPVVEVG
ncbi:hypothetical protein GCM10022419_014180 [Nonomuraea rosea]|uniref:Uncharacterized protein n=1 Tax=Nonomuraea rosea TaxID=638574 RepID=A0ABP6VH11_9ACTN